MNPLEHVVTIHQTVVGTKVFLSNQQTSLKLHIKDPKLSSPRKISAHPEPGLLPSDPTNPSH